MSGGRETLIRLRWARACLELDDRDPQLDLLGERLGFASREAAVRRRRRPPTEEPTDQLNVRASIADINQFVEWCERKRYSYREGFGLLVAKIEDLGEHWT